MGCCTSCAFFSLCANVNVCSADFGGGEGEEIVEMTEEDIEKMGQRFKEGLSSISMSMRDSEVGLSRRSVSSSSSSYSSDDDEAPSFTSEPQQAVEGQITGLVPKSAATG